MDQVILVSFIAIAAGVLMHFAQFYGIVATPILLGRTIMWMPELLYVKAVITKLGLPGGHTLPASFSSRSSDIFVAVPPKMGTTWTQHIVHTLLLESAVHQRTPHREKFQSQDEVIPWLEMLGSSLHAQGREHGLLLPRLEELNAMGDPRVFKTHLPLDALRSHEGRKIVMFRDPIDALFSQYKFFMPTFMDHNNTIPIDLFGQAGLLLPMPFSPRLLFKQFLQAWQQRQHPDVLLLFYEDMLQDSQGQILKIASFLGLSSRMNASTIEAVRSLTSFKAMRNRSDAFSDEWAKSIIRQALNYPNADIIPSVSKVREGGGKVGQGGKHLAHSIVHAYSRVWQSVVFPQTGFRSYAEMRAGAGVAAGI